MDYFFTKAKDIPEQTLKAGYGSLRVYYGIARGINPNNEYDKAVIEAHGGVPYEEPKPTTSKKKDKE